MEKYFMEEIIQKIFDNTFSDLAGLTAHASIPVSQSLVNEIIAAALEGDTMIHSAQASIHEQNKVSIHLQTSLWPLHLKLKLAKSVDFESFSSPKIRMWLENNHMLGSLASFFNALPGWARLYGNQVVIEPGFFLRAPAQKKLLNLIRSVDIRTEDGRIIFDVKIQVDEQAEG